MAPLSDGDVMWPGIRHQPWESDPHNSRPQLEDGSIYTCGKPQACATLVIKHTAWLSALRLHRGGDSGTSQGLLWLGGEVRHQSGEDSSRSAPSQQPDCQGPMEQQGPLILPLEVCVGMPRKWLSLGR